MKKEWEKDRGLFIRMFLTMFFLAALYLAFIAVLSVLGVSIIPLVFMAGVMLFAQYYFSDRLVLMSTGAQIVSEEEAPELHEIVSRLCINADIPKPKIAIVQSSIPNAFATGRNSKRAVVAVTAALMKQLNKGELEAVLAHELSHIKNKDVLVLTIAGFFSTIAFFLVRYLIFFGGRDRNSGGIMIAWIVSVIVWLLSFLLIRALSRYREFAADRGSAILTGQPSNLILALLKISGRMEQVPKDDLRKAEGMNAFYIIPALSGESILGLLSTHPPIEKRIEALEKIEQRL
ncbi:MAG: zinc metalloprotease HtpX [Candidatus Methanoliparum thermophilum]|uniref:Protease HtpX homolog n=1 Tax=Methanoliparum thermophilum TaxID=2491083 RepID=A0A520KSG9_METT2|nr:zinc metalloprotease HtpX [Candidatus Methanoliparum sp. LAM-1]RZN64861.1 MAG: zinc metalloprotease HtpX [Candidatus Methanoliparum thermophilum]BDC36266.1 heat-shock protein HtpX [Candidatus Methanoliparum sp. LAM-1]